jgi:hypothetical protein
MTLDRPWLGWVYSGILRENLRVPGGPKNLCRVANKSSIAAVSLTGSPAHPA